MESIKQINQEFKPVNESRILKSGSNENELNELWDIESAGETAPGEEKNIILTPAVIEAYFNGEDVPELQKAIDDLTEWYNLDYFRYNNYLLLGSDASYGGRRAYFSNHNYLIKDYYTAIDDGIIEEDYYEWWGYEDSKLFTYAKDILSEISKCVQ